MPNAITQRDITDAMVRLGVESGDILLVHSSYKSLGPIEGGADAVIAGIEAVLGKEGTLAFPALVQRDFEHRRESWYMDKPTDVGYLAEYFRKQIYVYRSNHPGHSMAARGKYAYELTFEHTAYGHHPCPWGNDTFAESSPWAKLYRMNGKVLLMGCGSRPITMKHYVESLLTEELLLSVEDSAVRTQLQARLKSEENGGEGVFLLYHAHIMQDELEKKGLLKKTTCGNAELYLWNAKEYVDAALEELRSRPEFWYNGEKLQWFQDCVSARKGNV